MSTLTIELWCVSNRLSSKDGGLGAAGHFWNVVELLWPEDAKVGFDRTPWAERIVEAWYGPRTKDNNLFLGLAGCASSGKSGTMAIIAIVTYLSNPANTKVVVTSTELKAAQNRIWGSITRYWNALPLAEIPGKLVDSQYIIRGVDLTGEITSTTGIELVAADKKKEKEAITKLMGFKAPAMALIADELPALTDGILEVAVSNLSANPEFTFCGIGNPASYYDPFGKFVTPKRGWTSIDGGTDEWQTRYGKCIRFDGERSPNVLAGKTLYKWMPTLDWVMSQRKILGQNSPGYWRMVRGFFSPTGAEDMIFAEADFQRTRAVEGGTQWVRPPTRMASLDASFTEGGDRCVAMLGLIGESVEGFLVLEYQTWVSLTSDVTDSAPRNFQLARKFRDQCFKWEVTPHNVALDTTGAGVVFIDILYNEWPEAKDALAVGFGGCPTARIVSDVDPVPANVRYKNRVTQLWYQLLDLLQNFQIRGCSPDLVKELCARKYATGPAPNHPQDRLGLQYQVERKGLMHSRAGFSPDVADAAVLLVDLGVQRYGLTPGASKERRQSGSGGGRQAWDRFVGRQAQERTLDDLEFDSVG